MAQIDLNIYLKISLGLPFTINGADQEINIVFMDINQQRILTKYAFQHRITSFSSYKITHEIYKYRKAN